MRCDEAVALVFDPANGGADRLIGHRHGMGVGMDEGIGTHHKRHMAFPEQKVIAFVGAGCRAAE